MKNNLESGMVDTAIELHDYLTKSEYELNELRRIYIATSVSDYFKNDTSVWGYVPHKRKLQKKNFFV